MGEICRIMKSLEDKEMEAKRFITCDINAPNELKKQTISGGPHPQFLSLSLCIGHWVVRVVHELTPWHGSTAPNSLLLLSFYTKLNSILAIGLMNSIQATTHLTNDNTPATDLSFGRYRQCGCIVYLG